MNKPELSVTLKFRGVTIEGMTVEELRELRDVLNKIVGENHVIEREYVPPYSPIWIYREQPYIGPCWTVTTSGSSSTLTLNCYD